MLKSKCQPVLAPTHRNSSNHFSSHIYMLRHIFRRCSQRSRRRRYRDRAPRRRRRLEIAENHSSCVCIRAVRSEYFGWEIRKFRLRAQPYRVCRYLHNTNAQADTFRKEQKNRNHPGKSRRSTPPIIGITVRDFWVWAVIEAG